MNRITVYLVLPAVLGAASIVNVLAFAVNRILNQSSAVFTDVVSFVAVLVVLAAFAVAIRGMRAGRWLRLIGAIVVMVAAGLAPHLADAYVAAQRADLRQAEDTDAEFDFQTSLMDRSDDLDRRAAALRPYTAEEALAFLEFAVDADYSARGLIDHTPDTFDLVAQAIDAKLIDPNAILAPKVADDPAETLTLAFYEKRVRPGAPGHIARHDWDMLKLLVAKGADLSGPDAAPLRADLARTVVQGEGAFVALGSGS